MRNADFMIEILNEMNNTVDGQILFVQTLGMSEIEREHRHHAELLDDAGLATWKSESMLRITNKGYDFLNAIGQDKRYIESFKTLLAQGKSLLEVANKIISIVNST